MSVNFCLIGVEVLGLDGFEVWDLGVLVGCLSVDMDGCCVDLLGYMICFVFVDIYGDGFECYFVLRCGVLKDLGQGLILIDVEFVFNGIGIVVLVQFYSWEGGMCGIEFMVWFLVVYCVVQMLMDMCV